MQQRMVRAQMASVLALLVTPVLAQAQGAADESGDARGVVEEGKKPSRSNDKNDKNDKKDKTDGKASDRSAGDRKGDGGRTAQGPFAVPSHINEAFTYPTSGGCQYSATVRGSVKTARGGGSDEPRFSPNLTVNAWVTCQNNTELRVTDSSLKDSNMSRSQLEQALELRASLLSEGPSRRCVYLPDFSLGDNRLTAVGVSYLCPSGATGGGLADNQDRGSAADDDETKPSERPAGEVRSRENSRSSNGRGPYDRPERGDVRDDRGREGRDRRPVDDGQ